MMSQPFVRSRSDNDLFDLSPPVSLTIQDAHTMTRNRKQPPALSRRPAAATLLAVVAAVALSSVHVVAEDFQVSPDGQPLSIEQALDVAGPGDTVVLSDGVYSDPILTVRSGEEGSPITITGGSGAIINGAIDDRVGENKLRGYIIICFLLPAHLCHPD